MDISNQVLLDLGSFDTPTICNIIELFDIRPRNQGFLDARIRAAFPEMPPIVGFAATATFRSAAPSLSREVYENIEVQVQRFADLSGPPIVVFQDLDDPAVSATFGEIMCTTYQTFGAVGLITSGAGRDLDQVRSLGFPVFTNGTICAHGYCHTPDVHVPVRVGGVFISPDDLLHADCNGVTTIPREIACDVAAVGNAFVAAEAVILDCLHEFGPDLKKLHEARLESMRQMDELRQKVGRKKGELIMQRVTRDHTVPVEKRYRVREPAAEVELGESFIVETINFRTPVIRSPEDANPAVYREREETGPIFVRGIQPGDVLAVNIETIRPEGHASGGWWHHPHENSFLEIKDEQVHFPGGLTTALRMMIGDIYVTPDHACNNPDDNGGNMDFKDITAGNTLLLRAQLPGGLLVLGDCHAAQGDGEILGLAAECAAEVKLRITRYETFLPERPVILKPQSFVCLACRADYAAARDLAAQDAKKILAGLSGCTEEEAFLYVTTVGDLRNGAVWAMGKTEPGWMKSMPMVVGLEVPYPVGH